jgi:hypothetical protein
MNKKDEGTIFRTFSNSYYLWNLGKKKRNIMFMFEKEHKNYRKELRTLEKLF